MTKPVEIIDLTNDSNRNCGGGTGHLPRAQSNPETQWISKRTKLDALKKVLVRPVSARDNMISSEFRKDALWYEQAEVLFSVAMPQ